MTWHEFVERLETLQHDNQTNIALKLNPRVALLPHPIQRYDDPFLPFGKAVIQATRALVCAYVFDLAAYLSVGAAGAIALERTIAYLAGAIPTILHAPFTGQGYSAMADSTGFGVNAITVITDEDLQFYLQNPPFAAFQMRDDGGVPESGGSYHRAAQSISLRGKRNPILRLRVTGDDILYGNGTNDFADILRQSVDQMRQHES
jgi:hypothetical protein